NPPEVAVGRLVVDLRVRPGRFFDPASAGQRRLSESEEPAGREEKAARGGRLAEWRRRPLEGIDAERLEQLPARELRQRLAERALQRDPEQDDARRAVAELAPAADGEVEGELRPVL